MREEFQRCCRTETDQRRIGHIYTKILRSGRLRPGSIGWPWPGVEESGLRARTGVKQPQHQGEPTMSKRARKRRSRKGNAANHGRKPNA